MKRLKIVQLILFTIVAWNNYAQVEGIMIDNPRYFIDKKSTSGQAGVAAFDYTGANSLALDKPTISLLKERTASGKLYLKLDLGDDFVLESPNDVFDVDLAIQYRLVDNSGTNAPTMWRLLDFEINAQLPEQLHLVDLTQELSGYTAVEIKVDNVNGGLGSGPYSSSDNAGFLNAFIAEKLRFKATFVRAYKIGVRLASDNEYAPNIILDPIPNQGNKRVHFSWNTSGNKYPNYEIQILRVFNEDPANVNPNVAKSVTIDWSKALSIETQSYKQEIDLIVAEGRGWYTWRVRPIGSYYDGGIGNSDNYGEWSNAHMNGETVDFGVGVTPYSFFMLEQDDKKNWNYTRVFTEGDETGEQGVRTSEGITYADGLLRTRQAQQYNSSTGTTIISQTVSDYSGRPALSTLPVPVTGDLSGYKENFVQNSSGTVYTAEDYDDDINVNNPAQIKDANTAFNYYNGDRADGVADAEGYAYSRTIFKTDGTGRATESSGVGAKHAIGNRTTKVLYSSPSDAELIRIFGDEAPLAESVIKTITKDPNDVISLAYTSKEGKTIATALISDETDNLLELNDNNNAFTVENVTTQNVLNFNKFVSAKRIAIISDNTGVTLGYKVGELESPDCGGECNYKVRFYLTDLTNGIRYKSNQYDLPNAESALSITAQEPLVLTDIAGSATTITSTDGTFTLNTGEYLVTKEVFSETNANILAQDALVRADAIEEILLAITDKMDAINNNQDLIDFRNFMDNPNSTTDVEGYFANLLANPNSTADQGALRTALDLPANFVFPPYFGVAYSVTTGLEIIDHGPNNDDITNGANSTDCGGCGSTTVGIPTIEYCEVCEGTDGTGGVEAIRGAATSLIEYIEPTEGSQNTNWAAIKTLVDDHFITYLTDKLEATYGANVDVQAELTKIAPGFTKESLAYMLTNMLASRYYTDNTTEVGGYRYIAEENEIGGLERVDTDGNLEYEDSEHFNVANVILASGLPENYNYDCKELYHCWIQAVDMINSFEFEDMGEGIMEAYDAQQGHDSGDNDNSPSNQHADSDDAQDGSQSGNAILDFVISWKMRRFNESDDGQLSLAELEAIVSLPNLFMNCAKYKFAEIIDDEHVNSLPADYEKTTPHGSAVIANQLFVSSLSPAVDADVSTLGAMAPKMMAFDENGVGTVEQVTECTDANNPNPQSYDQLNYSYIVKPEWMFKYFVYNAHNNPTIADDDDYLLTQRAIEIASNYKDLGLCASPCFEVNDYYHESWNKGQRLSFYQQISGAKKTVVVCSPSNPEPQPEAVDLSLTEQGLLTLTREALEGAEESCQSRRGEIQSRLITALEGACYEIVEECDASGTQINELGLEAMTDAVVEECIVKVRTVTSKIFDTSNDYNMTSATYSGTGYGANPYGDYLNNDGTTTPYSEPKDPTENAKTVGFPQHAIISCCYLDEAGVSQTSEKRKITLFAACDQAILDQVSNWSFIPYIPPATGCTNNNTPPEWDVACPNGDCGTQECTPSGATEPNVYSTKTTISASTNQ
ncbi:MAG: hypothetical protein N4A35_00905 [Flavobacteriales bacterium]|jgi:hypothetical protein|nr:hypothetical protein [Flavobacteriales bacterium]